MKRNDKSVVDASNRLHQRLENLKYSAIKTSLRRIVIAFELVTCRSRRWTEKSGFFFYIYCFFSCYLAHLSA